MKVFCMFFAINCAVVLGMIPREVLIHQMYENPFENSVYSSDLDYSETDTSANPDHNDRYIEFIDPVFFSNGRIVYK